MTPRLTRWGYQSLIQALHGTGINFTKIALGNGSCPADYTMITNLSNQMAEVDINTLEMVDQHYANLTGIFTNQFTESTFTWTEVGIFCSNPNSTVSDPLDDVLYAYAHYQMSEDETAAAVIPKRGSEIFEIRLTYRIYIGELENITATLAESANYASRVELVEHIQDYDNPHHVTAEQIGIDAGFLNGTVNDLQVTYTPAQTATELSSGDSMTTAFSKIAKAVKDLISHIGNRSNPHQVTLAQVGAAAASHKHSTADITSGTLSVARGGTGKATATAGAILKGNGTSAFTEMSGTGAVYATTKNSPTFGTLPASCGGTGLTASPSMQTNLGSTTAADVFAASPRPGVTGTLPVANGGTGITAAPTLLVNLASTSTANIFAASPRPGVTGTLSAANGGTGQTSLQATRNAMGLGNTTGALPVANGGTGQTSLQATRNAMGLGNTTGALPVANGGTGNTSVDTTPTANSTKMCTSGGIKTAVDACVKKTMLSYNSTTKTLTITTT